MKNKKEIILLSFLIIIFAIILVPKGFQNDTFFTIACGQRLLTYGFEEYDQLTWHENLDFTNARYIFDIIIASIYNISGFLGIYVFVIVFTAIIGVAYYYFLIKRNNNYIFSFLATICIMYIGGNIFTARAQIISILIFIIESYCLEKLLETNNKKYWITLIVLPIIMSNTHASIFPVYLIFFLPYIAEAILYKFPFVKKDGEKIYIPKRKYIKSLFIILIFSILAGFCTPLGLITYTSMFREATGIANDIIAELQPIVPIYHVGFMILNIIFIAILAFSKIKISIADLFLIIGLDLLAFSTIRTSYYFIFIGSIVTIKLLNSLLSENGIFQYKINKRIKFAFYTIISFVFIISCVKNITINLRKEYVNMKEYPVEAVEFIINNLDIENMRIYNSFNFGSYLEYKGIKSFIDSRSGMFCDEFNEGVTILEDFTQIASGTFQYNEIFDKYNVTHAIFQVDERVAMYLANDNNWKQIYQDDIFVIYEKINN